MFIKDTNKICVDCNIGLLKRIKMFWNGKYPEINIIPNIIIEKGRKLVLKTGLLVTMLIIKTFEIWFGCSSLMKIFFA